jgi:methyl-accepting chemotaxis protein
MKTAKGTISAADEVSETDAGGNVHTLHQVENSDTQASSNYLRALVRQVSEASSREIGMLADEFKTLAKKLQSDGGRIQQDIEQYAELNRQIAQVAVNISDNMKKLPQIAR